MMCIIDCSGYILRRLALSRQDLLQITQFRALLKDYFLVCETCYSAIRTSSRRQIEAIDRERTKPHNEGAELMAQRLTGTIDIDQATARRLFALVSALRWRV
jgi:uncharacterized protein (UPF0262 family)